MRPIHPVLSTMVGGGGSPYRVHFLIVATYFQAADPVDEILRKTPPIKTPGLVVAHACDLVDQLSLSDTAGRARFSDFDYLSNLED